MALVNGHLQGLARIPARAMAALLAVAPHIMLNTTAVSTPIPIGSEKKAIKCA